MIYVINLELMIIQQKLDLTPCSPTPTEQYELNYNQDSKK